MCYSVFRCLYMFRKEYFLFQGRNKVWDRRNKIFLFKVKEVMFIYENEELEI